MEISESKNLLENESPMLTTLTKENNLIALMKAKERDTGKRGQGRGHNPQENNKNNNYSKT